MKNIFIKNDFDVSLDKMIGEYYSLLIKKLPVSIPYSLKNEILSYLIDAGFTSVMIDGSSLSLSENIELTKRVVEYAHSKNVSVEGELGTIGGTEEGISVHEDDIMYTRPEDAQKFLKETNVDALAIAIGTSHGQYKSKAKLNFEVLKKINEISDKPLVLHGGTGVSDVDIKTCITNGISKINVGTERIPNLSLKSTNFPASILITATFSLLSSEATSSI